MIRCFGKNAAKSQIKIRDCECIMRIINAERYYKSVEENIDEISTQNVVLEVYFNEEYKHCLNDYNHVISTHSEHLEEIHCQLNECRLSQCKICLDVFIHPCTENMSSVCLLLQYNSLYI